MSLFRSDISKLTYEEIDAFCKEQIPENTILDYKFEAPAGTGRDLVIKAVSALANTQGGVLVFGVRAPARIPILPIEGMRHDPGFISRVEQWCLNSIQPPIVPFVGYVLKAGDPTRAFAVVRVEPSDLAHTVDGGRKLYVRHGDNSVPQPEEATFEERELLRNRREQAKRIDAAHAEDLQNRVDAYLWRPCFLLTVLPRFASENALPRERLFRTVDHFRRFPYLDTVYSDIRSYSHGVLGTHDDPHFDAQQDREELRWRLALTTRGAMAVGNCISGMMTNPLRVKRFIAWARMASEWTARLAIDSEFWGVYDVTFRAPGWGHYPARDRASNTQFTCPDNDVSISLAWSSTALREDANTKGVELCERILWAFGHGNAPMGREKILDEFKELDQL